MVFAEIEYPEALLGLSRGIARLHTQALLEVESGLQGDSWIWIFDGGGKVAIDTLRRQFEVKVYEEPELEAHEDSRAPRPGIGYQLRVEWPLSPTQGYAMLPSNRTVTLCGKCLSGSQHICAFFDSTDEQYQILNPFFREGIEAGEEVVTIVESGFLAEHLQRMRAGGLPVDAAITAGQLKLLASEETYLKDRVFVVDRMYALLEEALRDAARRPRGGLRLYGDTEWVMRNLATTDELMVYEARLNLLTPQYSCTILCAYDINRCSGRMVADLLATHSHVILDGQVQENPYFVEPLAYLKKVSLRRKHPAPIQKSSVGSPSDGSVA